MLDFLVYFMDFLELWGGGEHTLLGSMQINPCCLVSERY